MKQKLLMAGIAAALLAAGTFTVLKLKSQKIENGVTVPQADFPYVVKLINSHSQVKCAGIALAERWVLTAAHCVPLVNGVLPVDSPTPLDFTSHTREDLALLFITTGRLRGPWPRNRILRVDAVNALPSTAPFIAFGYEGNPDLSRSNLLLRQPAEICQRLYVQLPETDELCVGQTDMSPCRNDSGGPLFTASGREADPAPGSLVGIVSKADTDCRNTGPALFSAFEQADLDWIESLL
jgi:secreted trypsin-like serine protease